MELDPQAVNLAKAIRQTESGGNFQAKGKSGEYGAYQFTTPTWQKLSTKYGLNIPLDQATPEQQNEAAYKQIKEWKDAGYNVGQIASMWNAGEGKPNAYLEGNKGVNKYGVKYDTAAYAKSVAQAYQTLKGGGQVGMDPNNPSSVSGSETAPSPQPSVSGFAGNVISSGANFLGGIGNAIAHPIDTLSGIANLGAGAVEQGVQGVLNATGLNKYQKGGPINTPESQMAAKAGDFYNQRYGISDIAHGNLGSAASKIGNTLYTDPVGAAADASVLLGGAGAAIGKAGELGDVAALSKVGGALSKAGEIVDPLRAAGRLGGAIAGVGGRAAGEALGHTTGVGYGPIREMFTNPSQEATAAMRGATSGEDVVNSVREGVNTIKEERGAQYRSDLANLSKDNPDSLDISPLTKSIQSKLDQYKIGTAPDGTLDFSRSPVSSAGQSDIQEAINIIQDWGSKAGDRTPEGLHILQQKLGDMIPKTGQARAFITSLKSQLTDILNTAKGFPEMQAKYAQTSGFIDDINRSLLSGNNETAINKITSLMRRNKGFKLEIARQLEEATGEKIIGKVAGMELNPARPRGLTGNVIGGGEVVAGFINPAAWLGLLASSPRLVGEVTRILGLGRVQATRILEALGKSQIGSIGVAGQRVNTAVGGSTGLPSGQSQ